ncbi:hypothetical protein [Endozoicomonas arenosclerae]|uniref:hypothetical protein n=1 Tax=Endozoicomonas arenosclerae TaxID=1633495 RepID=UPI000AF9AFF9|nr:hypothetical protein [Endozoicomonas arenosclerae]
MFRLILYWKRLPGPIASQDAYNALIYFSHPLILVAGNLSLAKVISMHKVPLYEWRSFQTDVNKDLKAFWQGTALDAFFENRYAPQEKSEALKALNFNPLVLREVSQRIMSKHNIIPTLLDSIWLTHQPSHPLWQLDQDAREIMAMPSSRELLSEIQAVRDLTKREILAGKIILNYTQTAQPILSSYELGTLFSLIEDPVIKAYLKSLLEKR